MVEVVGSGHEHSGGQRRLGIAVVTYSRLGRLRSCVDRLRTLTVTPHHLVIADDGSCDDTVSWCHEHGIRVVTGRNRGVAHNKNRGLLALEALACDPIFLFEDDMLPSVRGWDCEWIAATKRWHHVAFAHKGIVRTAVAGNGTADDPWVSPRTTAQLLTISATALSEVGYLDPRFEGWGHEHAEWTSRIKRAGYGFREITLPDGKRFRAQLFLNHGLTSCAAPSWRNEEQARRNRQLQMAIQAEPIFRTPWRTARERAEILAEIESSGVDPEHLAQQLDLGRDHAYADPGPTPQGEGRSEIS